MEVGVRVYSDTIFLTLDEREIVNFIMKGRSVFRSRKFIK